MYSQHIKTWDLHLYLTFVVATVLMARHVDSIKYESHRAQILKNEKSQSIGGGLQLATSDEDMDKYIRNLKQKEYHDFDEERFLPAHSFLEVKKNITESALYSALKTLPKGASLHTHILAATDVNFIVKTLCYMENLYMYQWNGKLKLKFLNASQVSDYSDEDKLVKIADARKANKDFDNWLIKQLTVTVDEKTRATRWMKLSGIFTALYDMLTYRPCFERYLHQALKELQEERVIYAEFRGTFMEFYELDGTRYDIMDSLKIMSDVIQAYTTNNTEFIGAKYIFSPYRKLNADDIHESIKLLQAAHRKFPHLVVGFDLVGHEDAGGLLFDHVDKLQRVHKEINFYFHAGETNWHGTEADGNLLDAILLGATRIGHALSLAKHPEMLALVKSRKIAIEVAPVSNQVLGYAPDLRSHPATIYARYGIPLIICNDDPTAFGNVGLSYDFYEALMAFTHVDEGIEFLKAAAINSIGYSSMNSLEQRKAYEIFHEQWAMVTKGMSAIKSLLLKYVSRNK